VLIPRRTPSQESSQPQTRPSFARKIDEAERSRKEKHRKMTLEMLEGLPFPPEAKELAKIGSLPRPGTAITPPEMDSLHPESAAALTAHRREAIRLAKSQERAVAERCKRSNQDPPGYTFDELIGKGSFGRVYKG
jgi:hypothetical protein